MKILGVFIHLMLLRSALGLRHDEIVGEAISTEESDFLLQVLEPTEIPLSTTDAVLTLLDTKQKDRAYPISLLDTEGAYFACKVTMSPFEEGGCDNLDESVFSPDDYSTISGIRESTSDQPRPVAFLTNISPSGQAISNINKLLGNVQGANISTIGKQLVTTDRDGSLTLSDPENPTLCCSRTYHKIYNLQYLLAECKQEVRAMSKLFNSYVRSLDKLPSVAYGTVSHLRSINIRLDDCTKMLEIMDIILSNDLSFVTKVERDRLQNMRDTTRGCQDEIQLKTLHFVGSSDWRFKFPITFLQKADNKGYVCHGELFHRQETYDVIISQYLTSIPPVLGYHLQDWSGKYQLPRTSLAACGLRDQNTWYCPLLQESVKHSRCKALPNTPPYNAPRWLYVLPL